MRKKYSYFVNGNELSRKDFIHEFKMCCQKVVRTDVIAGGCGIDICEPDEKRFNKYMRQINKNYTVCFADSGKSFYRKEVG